MFNNLSNSVLSSRFIENIVLNSIFIWFIILFIVTIFSLIIFVNEELETSIFEIFFETIFIVFIVIYIPNFFIFGYSLFTNNTIIAISFLMNILLPFIEIISQFLNSITLCLSINTNFVSGHILIAFFILLFENFILLCFISFYFIFFIINFFIYLLESFICILQVFVVLLLTILFVHESSF